MALRFTLYAAGVLAPGLASLTDLLALRRTGAAPANAELELPSANVLPANERRRASYAVRLTLACAEQALASSPFPADSLRLVFASDEGTGEVCQQMLESLASTRQVSPLLFHNSVHNAPSGYWSIGYRNRQSATSVSLGPETFASGLLCAATEAVSSGQPVLFMAYDPPMTEPMHTLLPIAQATATAWIIDSRPPAQSGNALLAQFELSLHAATSQSIAPLPEWIPQAWAHNSSVMGLVALALLDEPGQRPSCDFQLGAQRLRIQRIQVAPPC